MTLKEHLRRTLTSASSIWVRHSKTLFSWKRFAHGKGTARCFCSSLVEHGVPHICPLTIHSMPLWQRDLLVAKRRRETAEAATPEPLLCKCKSHTHTLAQDCHCELWSGARPTCKKQSSQPDRNGCEIRRKFSVLILTEGCWSFQFNKIRLRNRAENDGPNTAWRFLGWASSHVRKYEKMIKIDSRYVTVISRDILVSCMELRWRQPCSDPVAYHFPIPVQIEPKRKI